MYYSFHKNTKHYKATLKKIDNNKKCFLNSKSAYYISKYYCFYCIFALMNIRDLFQKQKLCIFIYITKSVLKI